MQSQAVTATTACQVVSLLRHRCQHLPGSEVHAPFERRTRPSPLLSLARDLKWRGVVRGCAQQRHGVGRAGRCARKAALESSPRCLEEAASREPDQLGRVGRLCLLLADDSMRSNFYPSISSTQPRDRPALDARPSPAEPTGTGGCSEDGEARLPESFRSRCCSAAARAERFRSAVAGTGTHCEGLVVSAAAAPCQQLAGRRRQ